MHTHRIPLFVVCNHLETDCIAALVVGADHVLHQPLSAAMLEAHLRSYWRGPQPPRALPPVVHPMEVQATFVPVARAAEPSEGHLRLDTQARRFHVGGVEVSLTAKEFEVMAYLMARPGLCVRRDDLLDDLWGLDFDPGTNVVDVVIYGLRRKLKPHGMSGAIETVRRVGYRLQQHAVAPTPETADPVPARGRPKGASGDRAENRKAERPPERSASWNA
ncbi:MAG: winged helix-turn-helix domain-containing protein [Bacteroidota bacterium]